MCSAEARFGVFEIDVLVGGAEHDLLKRESQETWLARRGGSDFDIIMLFPLCGHWSRASWANDDWPKPCRNRAHPWYSVVTCRSAEKGPGRE